MKQILIHSSKTNAPTKNRNILCASIALVLAAFPQVHAETLWAKGVSKTSGWVDNDQYLNHCWATSSSQVIDWWQTLISEKYVLPDTAVLGVNDLRNYFWGIRPNSAEQVDVQIIRYLDKCYSGIDLDLPIDDCDLRNDNSLEYVSKILWDNLSLGAAGVLTGDFPFKHAVTLWGAEFDDKKQVTKIYITDSDSTISNGLEEYVRQFDTDGSVTFVQTVSTYNPDAGYTTTQQSKIMEIDDLDFLRYQDEYLLDKDGKPFFALIPEPSAFGMFAGLFALAFTLSRRRRKC